MLATPLVLICALTASGSGPRPDVSEVLRHWERTAQLTAECAFESERLSELPLLKGGVRRHGQTSIVYREANGRFASIRRGWDPAAAMRDDGGFHHTVLNPGAETYQAMVLVSLPVRGGTIRTELQVFPDLKGFKGFWLNECGVLDGYAQTGTHLTPTVLLSEAEPQLEDQMDDVGGRKCYVITASCRYGKFKLWLDPQRDYGLVRAEIQKDEGDLLTENVAMPLWTPVPTDSGPEQRLAKRMTVIIDSVTFVQIDGHWIADGATMRERYAYDDIELKCKTTWRRTNIVPKPNFDKLRAFEIDIPEGIQVVFEGSGGVRHVWRDGKPVPAVDVAAVEALDKAVDTVKGAPTTQPNQAPTTRAVP